MRSEYRGWECARTEGGKKRFYYPGIGANESGGTPYCRHAPALGIIEYGNGL